MPTININFDASLLAHLLKAQANDTISVNISLGKKDPEPAAPAYPKGPLAPLMRAGLLEVGTTLTFHQRRANRTGRAVVTADGALIVDGNPKIFASPSKAAEAITGNVINGWTLWHRADGKTLDELRDEL